MISFFTLELLLLHEVIYFLILINYLLLLLLLLESIHLLLLLLRCTKICLIVTIYRNVSHLLVMLQLLLLLLKLTIPLLLLLLTGRLRASGSENIGNLLLLRKLIIHILMWLTLISYSFLLVDLERILLHWGLMGESMRLWMKLSSFHIFKHKGICIIYQSR